MEKIRKSDKKENEDKETKELLEIYNKDDIMLMFNCENDKALRFMRLMFQMKVAIKIGKEYYVLKEDLLKFMEDYKGRKLLI